MTTKLIRRKKKTPKIQNVEERRFIIVILVFLLTASLFIFTFDPGNEVLVRPIIIVFILTAIIALFFVLKNHLQPARLIITNVGFIVVTLLVAIGGIHDDAMGGFYILLIIATLLFGRKGLLVFGFLNTVAIVIIGVAETSGKITTHFGPLTDPSTVFTSAMFMVAASLTLYFFVNYLYHMIETARRNEEKQKRANLALNKLKATLEQRVKDSTAELNALFTSMQDLVIVYDKEGRYLKVANTNSELLVNDYKDRVGKTVYDVFPKELADRFVHHIQTVLKTEETMQIEYVLEINHKKVWFNTSVSPLNKESVIWMARDISDRKFIEEESRFVGTHDKLTKLYNRAFFEEELTRMDKSRLYPVSLFMIDMDALKTINDTQGHAAGDKMLQRIAEVLMIAFRAEDIVARIGGDEFAVILPLTDEDAARKVLARIRYFLELNNKKNKNKLEISIGVATCKQGGSLMHALKKADDTMYIEKRNKG